MRQCETGNLMRPELCNPKCNAAPEYYKNGRNSEDHFFSVHKNYILDLSIPSQIGSADCIVRKDYFRCVTFVTTGLQVLIFVTQVKFAPAALLCHRKPTHNLPDARRK
jgi:hypothetical protein